MIFFSSFRLFCFQRFFFFDDFSSVRWIAAISFSFNSRRNNLNWNANYEYGDDWIKQWMEQIWFVCLFLSSFWSSLILHAARKYFEKKLNKIRQFDYNHFFLFFFLKLIFSNIDWLPKMIEQFNFHFQTGSWARSRVSLNVWTQLRIERGES